MWQNFLPFEITFLSISLTCYKLSYDHQVSLYIAWDGRRLSYYDLLYSFAFCWFKTRLQPKILKKSLSLLDASPRFMVDLHLCWPPQTTMQAIKMQLFAYRKRQLRYYISGENDTRSAHKITCKIVTTSTMANLALFILKQTSLWAMMSAIVSFIFDISDSVLS